MANNDLSIWEGLSAKVSVEDLKKSFIKPCKFQKELAVVLEKLFWETLAPSSIEVGSAFGITSALLSNKFDKTLLDLDLEALKKAELFFKSIGQQVRIIHMDMFRLNEVDTKYDLVFNAGVLEHFGREDRRRIISNMSHITKSGGYIVIAVPNHNSLPYRLGYQWSNLTKSWIYPKEFKIKDLSNEVSQIDGIKLIDEFALDKSNIYNYLPLFLEKLFKLSERWFDFEGYLKVFIFKKTAPGQHDN